MTNMTPPEANNPTKQELAGTWPKWELGFNMRLDSATLDLVMGAGDATPMPFGLSMQYLSPSRYY